MNGYTPHGVIANVFTVFKRDRSLDDDGQLQLLEALEATNSVSAYFVRSGMGQMYTFTLEEVKQIAGIACAHFGDRAPVLVGASGIWDRNRDRLPDPDTYLREAIDLTRFAEQVGAAGAVHTIPEGLKTLRGPSPREVTSDYFRRVADATAIPILIYQPPGTDPDFCVTPESLAELAGIDRIRGIKVSSPDAGYVFDLCRALQGTQCVYITGHECAWLWGLHCGSKAVIGQGSSLNPAILKAVQDRFDAGDVDGARDAQQSVNRLVAACPDAVGFLKRYLNDNGHPMGATFRPAGANRYLKDPTPMTDAQYNAFKAIYESELAPYQ